MRLLFFPYIALFCFGNFAASQPPSTRNASFTMSFTITAPKKTTRVELDVVIPKTIANRQQIKSITYSLKPAKSYEFEGNSYVQFVVEKPTKTEITVTVDAEITRDDFSVASSSKSNRRIEKKDDLKKWLIDEKYLEKDAREIREVAKKLLGSSEIETARQTMNFVTSTMQPGAFDNANHGALWALKEKKGDCTEFADLFIALCRANGLPARFCQGYILSEVKEGDTPKHDWAEVHFSNYGWVPFDPRHVYGGSAKFDLLRPIYVYLDNTRQNRVLNSYHYFAYTYYGDAPEITGDFKVKPRK